MVNDIHYRIIYFCLAKVPAKLLRKLSNKVEVEVFGNSLLGSL